LHHIPLQYLNQIDQHHILPALTGKINVPSAVVDEIAVGRVAGVDLPDMSQPDWVVIKSPALSCELPDNTIIFQTYVIQLIDLMQIILGVVQGRIVLLMW
jgi:hypothetical protein